MTTLWRVIADPIRGVTPLWKVAVLYSIVGGGILSIAIRIAATAGDAALRTFGLVAFAYSAYITVAIYRCAGSCGSPRLAWIIRIAAALSLLSLPFLAYLFLTGRVTFAA
jgi:hypothetical protein